MNEPILYYSYLANTLPEVRASKDNKALKRPEKSLRKFEEAVANYGAKMLNIEDYKPSKNVMVWGAEKKIFANVYLPRRELSDKQRESGFKTILGERGYLKRDKYYSIGLTNYANEINNEADFKNEEMPSDRAKDLNIELKPWKQPDKKRKYVLFCGQTYNDANVNDLNDYQEWLTKTLEFLLEKSDRKIIYRGHPLELRGPTLPEGVRLSTGRTIEQDFALAATVVSHSSNSCVESVIEGIPSFVTSKKSVAWDVTSHDLSEINNPKIFDREQWLNNLAYTQWSLKEIEEGLPFKHLGVIDE